MAKQAQSKAVSAKARNQEDLPQTLRLLHLDEIERVRVWGFKALAQGDRGAATTVTLLGSAARRFEAAALRVKDVRMGPGGPEINFPSVKGGGTATVPISEVTWTALSKWCEGKAPNGPLLATEGGEFMHVATLWRVWQQALLDAGVTRRLGVHASRHAAGFLLLRETGDLTKVQAFLRHSTLSTTAAWYSHVHMPDLRAALAKVGI